MARKLYNSLLKYLIEKFYKQLYSESAQSFYSIHFNKRIHGELFWKKVIKILKNTCKVKERAPYFPQIFSNDLA